MAISATGSIDSAAGSRSEVARKGIADNFANFLVLLTTQLKNQDPTSPLDTNQFTQQLVSFAQVEQAVNTNSNLEKILKSNDVGQLNSAVSYLGKLVETEGDTLTLANGEGEYFYDLESKASQTFITITDLFGRTVYTGFGETSAGKHTASWNGLDQGGNPVQDGMYKVSVSALDGDGNVIPSTVSTMNVVSGVSMEDNIPMLHIGDNEEVSVPLDKVLSVRFKNFF